jgi:hypothetical protein
MARDRVKRFYREHERWYAKSLREARVERDEAALGVGVDDMEGGGTHGEWRVAWMNLGGDGGRRRLVPYLHAFEDAWHLPEFAEFVALLQPLGGRGDGREPTVDEIADALIAAGWEETTQRRNPEHEAWAEIERRKVEAAADRLESEAAKLREHAAKMAQG